MRRRLRYLRKLRELQARDLGGLVFDLRRFERKRDDLVAQKIDQIRACDDELRALETALDERRDLRDVREPGIGGTCPRCFAIFGSADRFCANCGAALGGAVQGPAQVRRSSRGRRPAAAAAPAPRPPPRSRPRPTLQRSDRGPAARRHAGRAAVPALRQRAARRSGLVPRMRAGGAHAHPSAAELARPDRRYAAASCSRCSPRGSRSRS